MKKGDDKLNGMVVKFILFAGLITIFSAFFHMLFRILHHYHGTLFIYNITYSFKISNKYTRTTTSLMF